MEAIPFPRYLDAPQRFLFWTVDQIVPFATLALIGMLMKMLFVCVLVGAVLSWGFARFRDSRPDGYLQHLAYWYGLLPLNGRACLNPFFRRIYPS
jgi:conjugal transfer pilus assembly protein TraL